MLNPAVSPHNENNVYVSCDMTQSFVTHNGGESWRMFNLRGPVNYYVFDPLDSNTVYANSIALFRSTDRGETWNVLYPDPSEISSIGSRGDEANQYLILGIVQEEVSWHLRLTRIIQKNYMQLFRLIKR